jgi:DivIVA domain-containing protein
MEMNPQRVRSAEFRTVRKGADPDEVRLFLNDVADELERAQNQSTAMEARARAAVARLQEVTEQGGAAGPATIEPSADEAETISRTLVLAQRTADTTIAEARSEAARVVQAANDEAAATLDSAREMSAQLLQEARDEARRVGENERRTVLGEVEALKARRDFLESDVDHLETFLVDQRARLRDAATSLVDIADRVPGGLGEVRRPLLSASDDEPRLGGDDTAPAADTGADDLVILTDADQRTTSASSDADAAPGDVDTDDVDTGADAEPAEVAGTTDDAAGADHAAGTDDTVGTDDPTDAVPAVDTDPSDEFRFSFDDERN